MTKNIFLICGFLLPAIANAACPAVSPGALTLSSEDVTLSVEQPQSYPVAELFSMQVTVCVDEEPWQGKLKMDALMPSHGHGMNYRPDVTMNGPGHFVVDGLMFHMPGEWQLRFDIKTKSKQTLSTLVQTN